MDKVYRLLENALCCLQMYTGVNSKIGSIKVLLGPKIWSANLSIREPRLPTFISLKTSSTTGSVDICETESSARRILFLCRAFTLFMTNG